NFMIGVTAAASAGVYLSRGYIDPGLAMPVMLGVLPGALLGARVLAAARTGPLRLLFGAVILVLALEMIFQGLTGGLWDGGRRAGRGGRGGAAPGHPAARGGAGGGRGGAGRRRPVPGPPRHGPGRPPRLPRRARRAAQPGGRGPRDVSRQQPRP